MIIVKTIREFTAAISQFLKDNNEEFKAIFDRRYGMMFTFPDKVNHAVIQIQIVGGKDKPFACNLLENGEVIKGFESDCYGDIEHELKALYDFLKDFRGKN